MSKTNIRKKLFVWKTATISLMVLIVLFNLIFEVKVTQRFGKAEQNPKQTASTQESTSQDNSTQDSALAGKLFPGDGEELPVVWNDLGKRMVADGVIDIKQLEAIYKERGGLDQYDKNLLEGNVSENMQLNLKNSGFMLNMFWALGLSNKNPILEEGPMQDKAYGGAENFASTGGWNIAKGDTMNHYSKHEYIALTNEQQALVEKVAKNIYRPCCGNSTYFPDCNHGMAMLGFIELMASQGASEDAMYRAALKLNTYWFPGNYLTIAKYFESKGTPWDKVDPKKVLGKEYSSSTGYGKILAQVQPVKAQGGGACGI